MKWIFFGYLALVAIIVGGIGASLAITPRRDPHTLYVSYAVNIKSFDSAELYDTTSSQIAGQVFECLYNYMPDKRPFELFPELATTMPTVSGDGRILSIPIRRGVHYYDPEHAVFADGMGPEVSAADFIFAWKRIASFQLASPNYSGLFQGRVRGLDDWWRYTRQTPEDQIDWDRPVAGLRAPDKFTLVIELDRPTPQFVYSLAQVSSAPVSKAAADHWKGKLRRHPIGSGPYCLAEHLQEQRIVLAVNPVYRGETGSNGHASPKRPQITRIQMEYFVEELPSWLLFQQGRFDINGIPKESFSQAINVDNGTLTPQMEAAGIRLLKTPMPAVQYIGINMRDPVMGKNLPLRQAISMAFDRKKYVQVYLNGRGRPAIGPIPPEFETFDPDAINPNTVFDPRAARQKVKEAEAINGGPIPVLSLLLPGTDTRYRQMADFMVSQIASIGLTIRPEHRTWARFQEMIDAREAQMYALGWQADYPDEQTFLQLFYSKNAVERGVNATGYSNAEFDALYERAIQLPPTPERKVLYEHMESIVVRDCPWILTHYPTAYTLYYEWVKNFQINTYAHGLRAYQSLDESAHRDRFKHP